MTVAEAYAHLSLAPGASVAQLHARYRELTRTAHPDHGGTVAAFTRLTEAYMTAKTHAQERRCPTCEGRGSTPQGRGFARVRFPCKACRGTGRAER